MSSAIKVSNISGLALAVNWKLLVLKNNYKCHTLEQILASGPLISSGCIKYTMLFSSILVWKNELYNILHDILIMVYLHDFLQYTFVFCLQKSIIHVVDIVLCNACIWCDGLSAIEQIVLRKLRPYGFW